MKKWWTNKWIYVLVGVSSLFIVVVVIYVIKKIKNKNSADENMSGERISGDINNTNDSGQPLEDQPSENKVKTLHPKIREKAREFIRKAKAQGLNLRITSGLRTWAEQDELYAQGRTKPGGVVTNAKGGYSNHNYGLAFDVVPIVNGKADWNSKDWDKIGQIGKSVGFKWGGDWKGFVDKPHFEMLFGNSLSDLRKMYASGNRQGDYVNIA